MLPQGRILYFYSYNGVAFSNPDKLQVKIEKSLQREFKNGLKKSNRYKLNFTNLDLEEVNVVDTQPIITNILSTQQAITEYSSMGERADEQSAEESDKWNIKEYRLISDDY